MSNFVFCGIVRMKGNEWRRNMRYGKIRVEDGNLIFFRHMIQNNLPCRDIVWAYIHREGENAEEAVKQMISNYLVIITRRKKRYQFEMTEHEAQDCLRILKLFNPEMATGFPKGGRITMQSLSNTRDLGAIATKDVVEASKASTGNLTLNMNNLDFVEMLHQVIGEFEERFEEHHLTMMVHFPDEPSVIYADGQRLWRVLENIFGNVTKYAMEDTRVYAEVMNAHGQVVFTLKNISAQPLNFAAEELTERFVRGDVARGTEGSGLGLSIAKSLTELQGGKFQLYLDGDLFKVTITFQAQNSKCTDA